MEKDQFRMNSQFSERTQYSIPRTAIQKSSIRSVKSIGSLITQMC